MAARGLDIANLDAVINVDISKDTEVHIHRVGRTGRAGGTGLALSLCAPNEKKWVKLIEEYQNAPAEWHDLAELDEGEPHVEPVRAHPVNDPRIGDQHGDITRWPDRCRRHAAVRPVIPPPMTAIERGERSGMG